MNWIWGTIAIYVGLGLFYFIVKAHKRVSRRATIISRIKKINEQELRVLQHDFSFLPTGNTYRNETHPYVNDLDIFGNHSLFQYLTRCQTEFGGKILASFLQNGIDEADIPQQQLAIRELAELIEWRQEYQAICQSDIHDSVLDNDFMDWMDQDADISFKPWLCIVFPIITMVLLYVLIKHLPWLSYFLAFLPAGIFAMRQTEKITEFQASASQHSKTLQRFAEAIQWVNSKSFSESILKQRQSVFQSEKQNASKEIKKLAYILHQVDLRNNFFGMMINVIFPWDYYWAYRLQGWKNKNRQIVREWFDTIGWFEAVSSISNLCHTNPAWIYPTVHKESVLEATDLGHPLIHESKRVCNDFLSATRQHIKIVTGSNMGGKSTFLRTVGMNIVLANCGSKVCASSLRLPYLSLYTSMRTLDALEENTSSFYAELKRLKMVLDAVDQRQDVYFLLDEILKGTNSNDRHTGAKALIKGLLDKNGSGLISTHDLELGLMEADHPEQIENICFEVEVLDDELYFDYKLKKGVSKSFNATHLMRNMGINI